MRIVWANGKYRKVESVEGESKVQRELKSKFRTDFFFSQRRGCGEIAELD